MQVRNKVPEPVEGIGVVNGNFITNKILSAL